LLIEDRDENGERGNEDSDADQTQLARTPSTRLIECGSNQNRQDEEDERSDKPRNQLPARQADLPEGPNGREGKRADVGVESRDPSFDQKITRGEKHRAGRYVIPAAPSAAR